MNKLFTLLLVGSVGLSYAQDTFKEDPNHSKKEIYQFADKEYLGSQEHKLFFKSKKGLEYEFLTSRGYESFYHSNLVKEKPMTMGEYAGKSYALTYNEDRTALLKDLKTGKTYGPYKRMRPLTDDNKDLSGFTYSIDDENYIQRFGDEKAGPYGRIQCYRMTKTELIYTYISGKDANAKDTYYLYENGKTTGPFSGLTYRYSEYNGERHKLPIYKQDKSWVVDIESCKWLKFTAVPRVTMTSVGWFVEGKLDPSSKYKTIVSPDGTKTVKDEETDYIVNAKGQFLKLKVVGGSGRSKAYQVTFEGKLLGDFYMSRHMRGAYNQTDYFRKVFKKVNLANGRAEKIRDENYFYSPTHGLVGPVKDLEVNNFRMLPDGHAYTKLDSTLHLNGKQIFDNVVHTNYDNYPEWWMIRTDGIHHTPYKNGKEVDPSELPANMKGFQTKDKPFVKIRYGGQYYGIAQGDTAKIGPVEKWDEFAVSSDGKNYAEGKRRGKLIRVNGESVANGFALEYDKYSNSFYWFSIEEKKLYLHKYKL